MRALQLYEPLFLALCRINRLARNGVALSYREVRSDILSILTDIELKADDDPVLREHYRVLKTPINYFIDDSIAQSKLPFARQWHDERLGYEKDGLAGDEAFFDYLDEALKVPPSASQSERLLVYYVCLGLGFQGFYFNQPERLRQYMRQLHGIIRPFLVEDSVPRLVPQAYQFTDQRDFARPPKMGAFALLAGVVCLLLGAIPLFYLRQEEILSKVSLDLRQLRESYQGTDKTLHARQTPLPAPPKPVQAEEE